jgi:hypothetical protein
MFVCLHLKKVPAVSQSAPHPFSSHPPLPRPIYTPLRRVSRFISSPLLHHAFCGILWFWISIFDLQSAALIVWLSDSDLIIYIYRAVPPPTARTAEVLQTIRFESQEKKDKRRTAKLDFGKKRICCSDILPIQRKQSAPSKSPGCNFPLPTYVAKKRKVQGCDETHCSRRRCTGCKYILRLRTVTPTV